MEIQQRLEPLKINYSYGPYNVVKDDQQWIRISEGCPWNHEFCYEPTEYKLFEIPEIERNKVGVMDMNLLCKPQALDIIKELGEKRVDGKVVQYEMLCGIDYRFLTPELAQALFDSRFGAFNKKCEWYRSIRIAWDEEFTEQEKIKDAIKALETVGYSGEEIMVFMICNWKIPYTTNLRKLDLCKVWGVKVADCYYDNQLGPTFIPLHWELKQIYDFRRKARKHNQMIRFKIDPQPSINQHSNMIDISIKGEYQRNEN